MTENGQQIDSGNVDINVQSTDIMASNSSVGAAESAPSCITSQEKELSATASTDFFDAQYEQCLSSLKRLMGTRSADPKVVHNKAIADMQRSGLTRVDEFRVNLQAAAQMAKLNLEEPEMADDADQVVIMYNWALMLFYQRQYRATARVLESALQLADSVDETFGRKLLFLHLETLIKVQQPEKVLQRISLFDKQFGALFEAKGSSLDADFQFAENINADKFKSELYLYRAKALIMMRHMRLAKRQMKDLVGYGFVTHPLLFLKSHVEYLRGNFTKSLRIIGGIPASMKNPCDTGESETVMHWNNLGCVHLLKGKHGLATMYYKRAIKENEKICAEYQTGKKSNGKQHVYHNIPLKAHSISRHHELLQNLGLALLFSGKPMLAFDYLLEVINMYPRNPRLWLRLAECCIKVARPSNEVDRQLDVRQRAIAATVGSGPNRKIILGTGVAEIKKPWEESAAMPTPTLEFGSLCVRNALMLLPKPPTAVTVKQDSTTEATRHEAILRWAGTVYVALEPAGFLRGVDLIQLRSSVLCTSAYIALSLNEYYGAQQYAEQLLAQPLLSGAQIYLGRMYLAEAQLFLDCSDAAVPLLNCEMITEVTLNVAQSTMQKALHTIQEAASRCEGVAGVAARHELDEMLKEAALVANKRAPDECATPLTHWSPDSLNKARGIMIYNLAVTHTVREELDRALLCLQRAVTLLEMPLPAHLYFFKLYLDLMMGRRNSAQHVIKDCFGHCTPNVPAVRRPTAVTVQQQQSQTGAAAASSQMDSGSSVVGANTLASPGAGAPIISMQ